MKHRFKSIVAVVIGFSLVACGGGGDDSSKAEGIIDSGMIDSTLQTDGESTPSTDNSDSTVRDSAIALSPDGFVTFETAAVRPLALSADGSRLFVTNTPNSTLDIFSLSEEGPSFEQSVPVGMEPVAVALNANEAWVVNHLSDSVSIVDISATTPHVVKTLLVGDEPRDIVFAGTEGTRAFITAAHRGQNGPDDQPLDAQLTTPGVGRSDVWVFDASDTGVSIGGDPIDVVTLFGDTPRALTVSPDNARVYVAVMNSGNRTTTIGQSEIAKPGPIQSSDGRVQPDTGLIVQFDGSTWRDETGSATDLNDSPYDQKVAFTLPDYDVFEISANDASQVINQVSGVGTILFNMISNPNNDHVYVTNTEALNVNRFEGQGVAATSVRGNFAESRISIINPNGVEVRNLNKHLDHTESSASPSDRQLTTAQPMGMAMTADGSVLYVAGFASNKVVAYDTDALESDSYTVNTDQQVALKGGGPVGMVLDEARGRLYTLTRFNNSVSVIDTNQLKELSSVAMANPEPAHVIAGREFLYNAIDNSSHGDASCGLCHVSGDTDGLAWDLGNPDQSVVFNLNPFVERDLRPNGLPAFHPMKGPMTTQSFRGMAHTGPMHWRGDRMGLNAEPGESVEQAAFREFNVAFPELLGRDSELSDENMKLFAQFPLEIQSPPNPIRALDNSLTPDQSAGRSIYFKEDTTGDVFQCNTCHDLDPTKGAFGTDGDSSVEGPDISQEFKVPHLRNMYQKVGKFGNTGRFAGSNERFGEQVRGFGFMHDGHMDTLDNFFKGSVFKFDLEPELNDKKRGQVVDFVMVMDSNFAPVVGQQVTLTTATGNDTDKRINLLMERAGLASQPECDLIAKGVIENVARGFLFTGGDQFQSDARSESYTYEQLRSLAKTPNGAITFTCVPPGSGQWMGLDRNGDDVFDAD